jgi:hypothetical protein
VLEFYAAVASVASASVESRLRAGDVSWRARGVLQDRQLAAGLRKTAETVRRGGGFDHVKILERVNDRYFREAD